MPATIQRKNNEFRHLRLNVRGDRYDFFVELINNLDFVAIEPDNALSVKREKERVIANITKGFVDKKAIDEGTLKTFPIEELFDE